MKSLNSFHDFFKSEQATSPDEVTEVETTEESMSQPELSELENFFTSSSDNPIQVSDIKEIIRVGKESGVSELDIEFDGKLSHGFDGSCTLEGNKSVSIKAGRKSEKIWRMRVLYE